MSSWTKTNPPHWFPAAVATERGWENPVTGEVLVAIDHLADASAPLVVNVFAGKSVPSFDNPWTIEAMALPHFHDGDTMYVFAQFSEEVTVTGTPTISLSIGPNSRVADYDGAHSTGDMLVFTYVLAGDTTTPGGTSVIAVNLNGGTIVGLETASHPTAILTVPVVQPLLAEVTII